MQHSNARRPSHPVGGSGPAAPGPLNGRTRRAVFRGAALAPTPANQCGRSGSARHHRGVKIRGDGAPVSNLSVFLSRAEAAELRDGLDELLQHFGESGRHAHISSPDYQTEITIAPEVASGE